MTVRLLVRDLKKSELVVLLTCLKSRIYIRVHLYADTKGKSAHANILSSSCMHEWSLLNQSLFSF